MGVLGRAGGLVGRASVPTPFVVCCAGPAPGNRILGCFHEATSGHSTRSQLPMALGDILL